MRPDPTPQPQDFESLEAQLLRFSPPAPPASLDARMRALRDAAPAEAMLHDFTLPAPPAGLDARIRDLAEAALAEELLGRFALPEPSAGLDARIRALTAPAVLARHPNRSFWRRAAPFAASAAGLAACAALGLLLRPQAPAPAHPSAHPSAHLGAGTPLVAAPAAAVLNTTPVAAAPVMGHTVPAGYEYQSSRTVYTHETLVGTVTPASGEPMRAVRCDSLERHLYRNPQTQETLEVDAPREDMVLENLTSY